MNLLKRRNWMAARILEFTAVLSCRLFLPAFATLGIIVFTAVWGEFLWQFTVLRDPENYTIQVALAQLSNTR